MFRRHGSIIIIPPFQLAACLTCLLALVVPRVAANTEKVIFVAPVEIDLPPFLHRTTDSIFGPVTPSAPSQNASLPVQFPTPDRAGALSLVRLAELQEGQRYEVRVCWSATQPTDFTLNIYQGKLPTDAVFVVRAAADFYTSDESLMLDPPNVDVDIILDPYLANIFPRSLVPTAGYIVCLAIGSVFLSGLIWRHLSPATTNPTTKTKPKPTKKTK